MIQTDYIVIGSGIAGLSAAHAVAPFGKTLVITKGNIHEGSTQWAQGGIAVALHRDDTPTFHLNDTLAAGDGLCNIEAVKILVEEGPARVQELVDMGAHFDKSGDDYSFTREAAHNRRRILHAGDATGREIEKTLGNTVRRHPNVSFLQNTTVASLIISNGECIGCVTVKDGVPKSILANAVMLASGGCGQVYAYNTNPPVATGDGIALAFRAGATVQDMEFTQFHPTTLYTGDKKPISLFLISEAVRGEGGILRNKDGDRFMPSYHPMAELAPRDAVARAVFEEMHKTRSNHVYLDLSEVPLDLKMRFPTIFKRCQASGIDIRRDFVPVAPAAHYFMGGISTDIEGRTAIPRLYAAGEVASLGIHGANRLASNSLLDGLVFGYRAGKSAAKLPPLPHPLASPPILDAPTAVLTRVKARVIRSRIRNMMWTNVGIVRTQIQMEKALAYFQKVRWILDTPTYDEELLELQNLITISLLITQFALKRTGSRGAHCRQDFPEKDPLEVGHYTLKIGMSVPLLNPRL